MSDLIISTNSIEMFRFTNICVIYDVFLFYFYAGSPILNCLQCVGISITLLGISASWLLWQLLQVSIELSFHFFSKTPTRHFTFQARKSATNENQATVSSLAHLSLSSPSHLDYKRVTPVKFGPCACDLYIAQKLCCVTGRDGSRSPVCCPTFV